MAVESETGALTGLITRYAELQQRNHRLQDRIDALVQQHMDGAEEPLETALAQYLDAAKSGSIRIERNAWDKFALLRRAWQEEMEAASRIAYDVVTERRP